MNEQVPAEQCATPRTDAVEIASYETERRQTYVPADLARQLERELIEARRSLRREESGRDITAKENIRLREELTRLRKYVQPHHVAAFEADEAKQS